MFSKALFKQSCKANWIKWLAVTISTCTMLAIVIIVLGNLGINDIRDSLKNIFVQADQESVLKENAVDGYDLFNTTVETKSQLDLVTLGLNLAIIQFDKAIEQQNQAGIDTSSPEVRSATISQVVENLYSNLEESLTSNGIDKDTFTLMFTQFLTTYSNSQLSGQTLTAENIIKQWYTDTVYKEAYSQYIENGMSETEAQANAYSAMTIANDAYDWAKENITDIESQQNLYNSKAQDYINELMYNNALKMAESYGYQTDEEKEQFAVSVKVISNTAISTYQFMINELKESNTVEETLTIEQIKEQAKNEATKSISDQMPEKVAEALSELGNMDMYGLIIGSIFYRIAGLLLPMVFVIMVANNLLAGQVDSGSMAYVLSTPTKRRTVTVTQLTYLVLSVLAMFLILTCVSVTAVFVVGGNNFAINYGEMLLFNLGAFLTIFAISGYCFMCSALFNRSKYSMSIGGGLTIFSLVCTILGLFGSSVVPSAMRIGAMDFFNYLSIITFFDTVSILNGTLSYLWKFGILLGIGVVTFIIGVFRFDKKDLPL